MIEAVLEGLTPRMNESSSESSGSTRDDRSSKPSRAVRGAGLLAFAFLLTIFIHPSSAQFGSFGGGDDNPTITVSAEASVDGAAAGDQFALAVIIKHAKHWHTQARAAELTVDGAIPTTITAEPGEGFTAGQVQWPDSVPFEFDFGNGPEEIRVYAGKAVAFVPVLVGPDVIAGEDLSLTVKVFYQACDDKICQAPTTDTVTVTLPIVAADVARASTHADLFKGFDASVFGGTAFQAVDGGGDRSGEDVGSEIRPTQTARPTFFGLSLPSTSGPGGIVVLALLSMLGGFVLNLTPCVLPVIPIKVMTISKHADSPGKGLMLGLWMSLGVIAFWLGIGLPVAFMTSVTDPSRLFGIWWVTLGIGVVIAAMGIGIMGMFAINLPQQVYAVNPKADSATGSFMFGVMTAVLGLPCFGFVAGALLAGAATMPPAAIMTIFGAIGIGMALPYLVLAIKPGWVEKIPRTGPASELVKQVMGLLLLAAAAYFIGSGLIGLVSDKPYLAKQLHWWAVALLAVVSGLWLMVRTIQISKKTGPRVVFSLVGIFLGGVALLWAMSSTGKAKSVWTERQAAIADSGGAGYTTRTWNPYSKAAFDKAREEGLVVVLDFTAEWCLNCKALKATVLHRQPVKGELAADDTVAFTVDLTSTKSPGWAFLRDLGQTGIPLLAVYTPDEADPWQANAYTPAQVVQAIETARGE